ncbi:hypothetical protein [Kitasatospora sp. McL0602]|uniref:hypothetical protein n=1 Tax=Kitasatospora sp. McL0602 TaxID=3439530 RepID=UPI003F88FF8B
MAAGEWVTVGVGVGAMVGSWGVSRWVGVGGVHRWGGRTHWEWVPFMFGVVGVVGALPRAVGASAEVLLFTDTLGRAVGTTAYFMVVRAAGMLAVRGLLRQRVRQDGAMDTVSTSSSGPEPAADLPRPRKVGVGRRLGPYVRFAVSVGALLYDALGMARWGRSKRQSTGDDS